MGETPLMHRAMRSTIVFCFAFALSLEARATSCDVPTFERSRDAADVVFVGRATAVAEKGGYATTSTFAVERVYRGETPANVEVEGGGLKGALFQSGKRYLVFGRIVETGLFAHLCGGTQRADDAAAWIAQLGDGKPPGTAIASGKPLAEPPPPSAEAPAPAEAPPPSPAAPLEIVPPAPPPAGPKSGCGGCAVARGPDPSLLPFLALLAAIRKATGFRLQASARLP